MKRKITQWTLTMVLAISLVACATSARYSSSTDDIYYSPSKIEKASVVKTTETTNQDAEIQQLKSATQAAIKENAKRLATDSTLVVVENDNSYRSIVSDSYEDSYERRLRGYQSPSYGTESVIRITTSSDWLQVTSFDPAFYNIIIMGDEIWVEPKYITSMFSPVRTTLNLGWGYGSYWNSWNYPRYGFGWNYYNSWYSWYNPWYWSSWNYPYYGSYWGYYGYGYGYGWNYGWNGGWGHGYYHGGHKHYNPHWGLGRPSTSGGNTYGRRTSGTMTQNRVSSAATNDNNRTQNVTGGTRRGTRDMEMVSNRTSPNTSTSVSAGNRRGDAVGNPTNGSSTQQGNTTGTVTRDTRNGGGVYSRAQQQDRTPSAQTQDSRRGSQVYTRPAATSRQNYNESTTTSGTTRNSNVTSSNSNTGVARPVSTSPSSSTSSSRSVSTSRYSTNEGSNSSSGSSSSASRRNSSSSNSSYTPSSSSSSRSSSSSSSSGSYSPSSSSSSRSSGSSSSGSSSSSSSSGGSRRR